MSNHQAGSKQQTGADELALPAPAPLPPRRMKAPVGAWDAHAHVVDPNYPTVANPFYRSPKSTARDFLHMLDVSGLSYGVLVQISVHGTDNSLMAEALEAHPDRLRGVAVVDRDTSEKELDRLKRAGVSGTRMLTGAGGALDDNLLDYTMKLCEELGWHFQVAIHPDDLPAALPKLLKSRVPMVVDHMGAWRATGGLEGPGFQAVLRLLRESDCWVKMSGAYRISKTGRPYLDTVPFARKLTETAPDKLVWATDFPFTGLYDPAIMPQSGELLDLLADWVPDEVLRRRILVENPKKLYGLPLKAKG